MRRVVAAFGVLISAICLVSQAQTGPAPEAAKMQVTGAPKLKPKTLIDPAAAMSIWNIKVKDKETTAAVVSRVKKQLTGLLNADTKKLDYDTDYWRLLAYLREVPWDKMPSKWKSWYLAKMPNPRLTDEQRDHVIEQAKKQPLYKLSPKELDVYLAYIHKDEPDLRKRVVRIARQNLGQPYQIYLLGEFPYEVYDADPMYCLGQGDCVVFSEHMYAMALSTSWKEFYQNLQKLRYKDGVPGMTTRNHYTEADWVKNNRWLIEDVTDKLDATTVTKYTEKIDRASFFKNFGVGQDIKPETLEDTYIPAAAVPSALEKLQDGDFVNVVRGKGEGVWVGHVGLIGHGADGSVHFIHSTDPKSKEQPIMEYVNDNVKKNVQRAKKGQAQFMGFKFHKLKDASQIQSYAAAE
ncbi:MAG: N-acetylmuramoyl-L-alanine amidase-like domain-containing protein [Candidatus Sumerlaeaceae bacterium]